MSGCKMDGDDVCWGGVQTSTAYLTAEDAELSAAYHNTGRALQRAGELKPADELLQICAQLRTEQAWWGKVHQSAVDKAHQVLQEVQQALGKVKPSS